MPQVEAIFSRFGPVTLKPGRDLTPADLQGVDVLLVRSITQVNEALLAESRVKFVGTATIGTDHIDQSYLASRGIGFSNAPGCNADAVVEYVLSCLYLVAEQQGFDPKERTYGIVGVGNVGGRLQRRLQALGYTVVDASTVVATHVSQLIQDYAFDLLGHDEVQKLLDKLKKVSPKLVEELVPDRLSLAILVKVLQNLLQEKVSIRDMRTILETLTKKVDTTKDAAELTIAVRTALGRSIIQGLVGQDEELKVITLEPSLEQLLLQATQGAPEGQLAIEPGLAERLHSTLKDESQKMEMSGQSAVLLVAPQIRAQLARLFRYSLPTLSILAYSEVPENRQISVVASVGQGG